MSQQPTNSHPDAQDELEIDPPALASDYPSETGAEVAAESSYEKVQPDDE